MAVMAGTMTLVELEEKLQSILEDQEKSSSVSSPTASHPLHVIEPLCGDMNRGCQSEISRGRPEERQGASRFKTPGVSKEEREQHEAKVVVDTLNEKQQEEEETVGVVVVGIEMQREEDELDELVIEESQDEDEEDDVKLREKWWNTFVHPLYDRKRR